MANVAGDVCRSIVSYARHRIMLRWVPPPAPTVAEYIYGLDYIDEHVGYYDYDAPARSLILTDVSHSVVAVLGASGPEMWFQMRYEPYGHFQRVLGSNQFRAVDSQTCEPTLPKASRRRRLSFRRNRGFDGASRQAPVKREFG